MFHINTLQTTFMITMAVVQIGVVAFGFTPHHHQHQHQQHHTIIHSNNNNIKNNMMKHPTTPVTTSRKMQDGIGEGESQFYEGNFFDEILDYNNDDDEDELPPDLDDEFEEYIPKINSVTLVGRVGQSPEPRYFNDNKVVLRLSLAVKRKYHPLERQVRNIRSGEEETDWFNLELWGRDAEYAGKYVTKGARIGITGSLNVDLWTDNVTGEERASNKIVVKHLDILESRAEAELRMGNSGGNYGGGNQGGGYGGNSDSGGGGDGASAGGSGGFFDN